MHKCILIVMLNASSNFLGKVPFSYRFNMSFHETVDDENDVEIDNDEGARPCFSSISKGAGSLDKELAASGFTLKDQEDIEKFFEGGIEGDADSGDEEAESFKFDEMDTNVVEQHLHMSDEVFILSF
ncbi:uncharacterized protein LOC111498539 isoform X2 [Cucurbita maxima]|uniref:Uncharacterized protein LOC111498539 isoform X2 n=1 Tax=Cucurbita maxima TaxID=3661 RepID=A0A6J1KVF6_CUCMA|nr:uncharacterized protein LOC111498539 isoform X2 [Cucurbita maxima]